MRSILLAASLWMPTVMLAVQPMTLEAAQAQKWSQASYVWDSEALLDPGHRAAELTALRRAGMDKIYLGLKGAQFKDFATTRQRLEQLLQEAAGEGLQVSLLLGDPEWMKPQERHQLTELLDKLKGLSFTSLHLDLEVEQLGVPVPDQHLKDLLDTLRAASREPLAGRDFQPSSLVRRDQARTNLCAMRASRRRCAPDQPDDLYPQPENSARMAEQIARRWPELQFRLAQSTEPQLDATESWAGASTEQLQHQSSVWREQLQPLGIAGIDWQAWRDFPKR